MVGLMLDASDKKLSWLSSESWLSSKFEHSGDALVPSPGMNQSFVYHAKNPVCARAKNDQRIIRPRIMDGRAMTKQQLRLEELAEEGRQWAKHPELKPKPRPEGRGMAFAMAHLDELLEKGKLQKQAREVASPQQSDEVFHDAVDPIDNEESIWMDTQESTESELEIMETAEDGPLPEVMETAEDGPLPEVAETGPLPEVVETAENGPLPEVMETAEDGPLPEVMETAENGPPPAVAESFLGGVQQSQNPVTEVEAEREDFSTWSFLRAAGLVCGCWGR